MSLLSEKIGRFTQLFASNPLYAFRVLGRVAIRETQAKLAWFGAISGFTASIYYLIASAAFRTEHQAVLKGKLAFRSAKIRSLSSSARLRRNTHRLEKGLIMRPRRPIFAEAYIGETVSDYREACLSKTLDEGERAWAGDVLSMYFSIVGSSPQIDRARDIFLSASEPSEAPNRIPYPSNSRTRSDVTFEELERLFLERRSTRWFEQRPVPRDQIEMAINAASLAPSACNRQPYSYAVLDNPEHAVAVAKLAGGTSGFADNIPCLIAAVGSLSCYPEERDRHLIYIDASLANMQLMLAFQTLGLSTCPINWPDIAERDKAIGAALDLLPHERVVMLIAVGFPIEDGHIPYSQKKPAQLLIRKDERAAS